MNAARAHARRDDAFAPGSGRRPLPERDHPPKVRRLRALQATSSGPPPGAVHVAFRAADRGQGRRFHAVHFCPQCGATVYYLLGAVPDVVAIPVGAFADPAFPAPRVSIYEERRHAWVVMPDGIGHHD